LGYAYDSNSNRTGVTAYYSGSSLAVTYGFDDAERLKTIASGSSTLVTYSPDPLSRIKTASLIDGSQDAFTWADNDDLSNLTTSYTGGSLGV
ncbi:hypothetical protein ABTN05_19605, partial [Acinetobacter baumannii]